MMGKLLESEPNPAVSLIEFHDAKVKSIVLLGDGNGIIEFGHLVVYHPVTVNEFEVWSYKAEIFLEDIQELWFKGKLEKSDYVSDGEFIHDSGNNIELALLRSRTSMDKIQLIFGSGSMIKIRLGWATLNLISPIRQFEKWYGPLE